MLQPAHIYSKIRLRLCPLSYGGFSVQITVARTCAGLLLSAIRDPDPVVFFEAKMLYRTVSEDVPSGEYTIPLGEARVTQTGSDITLVGWGQQVAVLERAVRRFPHCELQLTTRLLMHL